MCLGLIIANAICNPSTHPLSFHLPQLVEDTLSLLSSQHWHKLTNWEDVLMAQTDKDRKYES